MGFGERPVWLFQFVGLQSIHVIRLFVGHSCCGKGILGAGRSHARLGIFISLCVKGAVGIMMDFCDDCSDLQSDGHVIVAG